MTLIDRVKSQMKRYPEKATAPWIALRLGEWVPDVQAAMRAIPTPAQKKPAYPLPLKTFWQPFRLPG